MNDADLLRVREVVKALRRLRGRDVEDGRETLISKIKRWQHLAMPSIELEQVPFRSRWRELFGEMSRRILESWPDGDLNGVHHVGSSAIGSLRSKNMIDIAVVVAEPPPSAAHSECLERLGFENYGPGPGSPDVYWFWKLDHPEAVFVVHLCHVEDPWWQSALDFRDYLRAYPAEAARYEERKRYLAAEAARNPLAYSLGKIERMLELKHRARQWRDAVEGEKRDDVAGRV